MAGFKLELFKGSRPRISALKLIHGEAQTAENVDLGTGDLDPWFDKSTEQAVSSGRITKTIYRFDNNGVPVFLEWNDYVSVARGPVKGDLIERTYYTGDTTGNGAPKMTNTELIGSNGPYPAGWLYMGVPAPTTALSIIVPTLPEDVPSDQRFVDQGGIKVNALVIDNANFTVFPGTGNPTDIWRWASSASGAIKFNFTSDTALRVTEIINFNKVRLESASEVGIFARTFNSDKTTINDWQPIDEQGSTQTADAEGWQIPVDCIVTIVGHQLGVGDILSVTAIAVPLSWAISLTTDLYEQSWAEPAVVDIGGESFFNVPNARVSPTAVESDADQFSITGSFYYDVNRAASTVSELEGRTYVYTYVSALGEEGPPSPVSATFNILDGVEVFISDLELPPTIGFDITHIRIYRTSSSEAGTEYQFVKEIVAAASTRDAVPSALLGEVISTTTWDPPDPLMIGITAMPNGMLVGFKGKNIYMCEPYFPHAWPPEYDQAIDYEIVGLAAFGNSIAVMTKGVPYLLTGAHPRNVNLRPLKVNQACSSAQSIATDGDKVYYASPDGLVEISVNGIRVATASYLRKEDWDTFEPSSIVGEFHEGRYYGFYDFDISSFPPVITAEVSGTIQTANEDNVVNGGDTIILTLTNDIWVGVGLFDAQRQAIINGLTAATTQTLGWNNEVRDTSLVVGDVIRTSDTVVTITLPPSSTYSVFENEVIQPTIPAAALAVSDDEVATGSTFRIVALVPATSVTMEGTLHTATEAEIVSGGKDITLTLSSDVWADLGIPFDSIRQIILTGIVATTNQVGGWNDTVIQQVAKSAVIRTSDLVVTITLPAIVAYEILNDETVFATVPSEAVVASIVDIPTINSVAVIADGSAPSAVFSGSMLVFITESDIVVGGKDIIITLTNDTWIAAGTGPIGTIAETDALIAAVLATDSQPLGWNNVVLAGIETTDLARTSPTVATITLDPEATYSIATEESIGLIIPAASLTSAEDLLVSNTFGVQSRSPAICSVTGTIIGADETDIVDGGNTIILTLTSESWEVAGSGPIGSTANTQAIIDGLVAATSPANGWNNVVVPGIEVSDVVRTSDVEATITLDAEATYDISAQEVVTVTVPAAALQDSVGAVVAAPTVIIADDVPATIALSGTILTANAANLRDAAGLKIILTMINDTWVDDGARFIAQKLGIIAGLTSDGSDPFGWNDEIRDTVLERDDVERTTNQIVTITLPIAPNYLVTGPETITATIPADAISGLDVPVIASPTFQLDEDVVSKVMVAIARSVDVIRKTFFAFAEDTFASWTEGAVDTDEVDTYATGASIAYTTGANRWLMVFGESGSPYSVTMHTSDDDGTTWVDRDTFNDGAAPDVTGTTSTAHWNLANNVFLVSANRYSNLMFSVDGAVTWAESAVPFAALTAVNYTPAAMVYGGANFVYGTGFGIANVALGGRDYFGVRSADLSVGGGESAAWTEFPLAFDGSGDNGNNPRIGSANGKLIYVISRRIFSGRGSGRHINLYISTVPHGGTTETYVGAILDTRYGNFRFSAASTTKIVFINNRGFLLRVDVGDEGTISNWDAPENSLTDQITQDNVTFRKLVYDPGGAGKEGLGFVAVGRNLISGLGVIYTSPDGDTWTLSETLDIASAQPFDIAVNNPPDLD